jgi:hypothetical protein
MRLGRIRFSIISLGVSVVALTASSSALANPIDQDVAPSYLPPRNDCSLPASTQSLLAWGDEDSYFLASGGSFEGDSASDWYLANGAQVTDEIKQRNGPLDGVLEIPSGGWAVSPVICVTVDCPHARIFAHSVTGGGDVDFGLSYYRDGAWSRFTQTGNVTDGDRSLSRSWGLSDRLSIWPEKREGFQQVRFAFYGGGHDKTFQLDDFWVDPRASR